MCESEVWYYWVAFEDRAQECVIKDQGGIKATQVSYNHILLLCDCSWKRLCRLASLIGFVVSARSPSLPMGNTGNNWWLKLTWVLRGHEISFNCSPEPTPLPSLPQLSLVPWGKDILTPQWTITLDVCHTPSERRNSIRVLLLILCGWMQEEEGSSEGLVRMPGLQGCEIEDMAGKCEHWEAAIIQPSRMLSGCLVSPRNATTEQSTFNLLRGWPLGSSKTPLFSVASSERAL